MALGLIDKLDNIEIIRDQIAGLLVNETVNQQALAIAASKDPNDWKLRIYTERSNPWETWVNDQTDKSPIVNVWIDSAVYDKSASNIIERQKTDATINVDCYGYGISSDVPLGGHVAGDEMASLQAQKSVRLVRNILMAPENTYLQLRGLVWQRWPQSLNIFQPQNLTSVQQVVGARLSMSVVFNEFTSEATPNTLEYVAIDILRAEDGSIVLESDYQYPLP